MIVKCKQCNKKFDKQLNQIKLTKNNFCSRSCAAKYNNSKFPKRKRKNKINNKCLYCGNKLLKVAKKYCSRKCNDDYNYYILLNKYKLGLENGTTPVTKEPSLPLRRYIKEKYNNKCMICGLNEKNLFNDICYLEIHHKDGKSNNNKEDNLMLLCPNCHSLTSTYRVLNTGNKQRKKY